MTVDSIPWSAHPPTSRIPRAVKKEEKKENEERETRVNWCCFTEGGDVKFSGTHRVQIRLRKLSATFPGFFIHGHRFYFQPRRTPSCVKRWNKAIDLLKWERHVLREEGCGHDRVTIDWTSKNGQHASLRVMLKREVDYHVARWYVARIVYAITKRKIYKYRCIYVQSMVHRSSSSSNFINDI